MATKEKSPVSIGNQLPARAKFGAPLASFMSALSVAATRTRPVDQRESVEPILRADGLTIRYGEFAAVKRVTLDILPRRVTAIACAGWN